MSFFVGRILQHALVCSASTFNQVLESAQIHRTRLWKGKKLSPSYDFIRFSVSGRELGYLSQENEADALPPQIDNPFAQTIIGMHTANEPSTRVQQ